MALAGWHERAPLSLAQVEQRIARPRRRAGQGRYTFLICLVEDERPIGEVMLVDIDRVNGSAQVGIFIGEPDEWGKGYGTDAVRALVDFGFAELRLERDLARSVAPRTRGPQRSYEKAGFTQEATFRHDRWEGGRYTDGHVMSILRDEWQSRRS